MWCLLSAGDPLALACLLNRQWALLVNVTYVVLIVPEKERFYTVHVAVDVDKKVTSPTKVQNKTKNLSFCKN